MTLREQIVQLALHYDGACPTHRRDEYVELLTRGGQESKQTEKDMLRMSSCALMVRGLWYKVGVRHKRLVEPYQNGMAPRDVLEVARAFGALRGGGLIGTLPRDAGDNPCIDPYFPQAGDSFYILYPVNGKGEHFGTITKVLTATSNELSFEGVDGGQKNGGILKVTRTFRKRGGYFVEQASGKSLFYWFDADSLVTTV